MTRKSTYHFAVRTSHSIELSRTADAWPVFITCILTFQKRLSLSEQTWLLINSASNQKSKFKVQSWCYYDVGWLVKLLIHCNWID